MKSVWRVFVRSKWVAVALLGVSLSLSAIANTLKWVGASDITTWDIHSQISGFQNGVHSAVYEPLVSFDSRTFAIRPTLALNWKQVGPQQWRFVLRPGVRFHDGSGLSADDVVYSLRRAKAPTSTFQAQAAPVTRVEKVDATTVDIWSTASLPMLLAHLTELRIMSESWARAHGSLAPKDINNSNEDTVAHRKANGTGPFVLKEWVPRQNMVLVRHGAWWGLMEGNVQEIVYTPMRSDVGRINALASASADLMLDPNPQDLYRIRRNDDLKTIQGPEMRTIMLGMDQHRSELPGSGAKGRNPLKDLRVRRALYHAIDMDAIHDIVMRGQSQNTGTLVTRGVDGWTERLHERLPYSPEVAQKLLKLADLPQGFTVDFACPKGRYVNDAEVCQAIASMWGKVGVKARLRLVDPTAYFPMVQRHEASIYLMGWTAPTFDGLYALQSLLRTPGQHGDGHYNLGRYSNPALDKLIDRVKTETNPANRTRLLTAALQVASDDVAMIPLHNQVLTWVARKNVSVVMRPDNRVDLTLVKVD